MKWCYVMAVEELRVSGSVKLRGPLKLGSADVSGSLSIEGDVEVGVLEVSGSARISGNLIGREIRTSGSFNVKGTLEAAELRVSGSVEVSERVKVGVLDVSGSMRARDVVVSEARVDGGVRVGRLTGKKIVFGKDSEVSGLVVGCEVEIGRNAEVERVIGDRVIIRRGAEVGYVEANSVLVERGAEVEELRYVKDAEVYEGAQIHSKTRISELSEKIVCGE